MHNPGAQFAPYRRELAKMMQQRIHQRAPIALFFSCARSGMYRHAGRFVHYGKLGVFEHNVQWNVFRQRPQGRLRR